MRGRAIVIKFLCGSALSIRSTYETTVMNEKQEPQLSLG